MRKIKLKYSFLLITLFWANHLLAQNEGDTWVIGYNTVGHPDYSAMYLDFSSGELNLVWRPDLVLSLSGTASNICNTSGKNILFTNGMQIFGQNGERVADTIAYGGFMTLYWSLYAAEPYGILGMQRHSSTLILPIPGQNESFLTMYHTAEYSKEGTFLVSQFLQAKIMMHDDSAYSVIYQDSSLVPYHRWYHDDILATRHANGRDWWIVLFENFSLRYHSYILHPYGMTHQTTGELNTPLHSGLGQAVFSPQGRYIAKVDATTFDEGQFIALMEFDRCEGTIQEKATFHTTAGYFTGAAFSPSERYLYADDNNHLWQWDLWADDIAASQVLIDTFDGFVQPGWFVMRFGPMMQTPDDRIYIVPPAGSSEFMHVIERPDMPGKECRFLQHHINLTKPNARSAPNIPNFRLGPIDGSTCDTLGIDNLPVARWRYEENYPDLWYDIRFTDMSFYNPTSWYWDFDDGETSTEQHPVHTFNPGLYHVCLTVSNENASDSLCRWVDILPTSTEDANPTKRDLSVNPNPFTEALVIHSESGQIREVTMQLYDIHGRMVFHQPKAPVPVTIYLPESIIPGMYFLKIKEKTGEEYGWKVVKE